MQTIGTNPANHFNDIQNPAPDPSESVWWINMHGGGGGGGGDWPSVQHRGLARDFPMQHCDIPLQQWFGHLNM